MCSGRIHKHDYQRRPRIEDPLGLVEEVGRQQDKASPQGWKKKGG